MCCLRVWVIALLLATISFAQNSQSLPKKQPPKDYVFAVVTEHVWTTDPSVTCRNTTFRAILDLPLEAIDRDRRANSRWGRGTQVRINHVAVSGTEVFSSYGPYQ